MDFAFLNIGSLELLILIPIMILMFIIPIYLTVDLFKRDVSKNQLILSIIMIWLFPTIGLLIYYFLLRPDYPLKKELN